LDIEYWLFKKRKDEHPTSNEKPSITKSRKNENTKIDGFAKSLKTSFDVIPAKAGIQ